MTYTSALRMRSRSVAVVTLAVVLAGCGSSPAGGSNTTRSPVSTATNSLAVTPVASASVSLTQSPDSGASPPASSTPAAPDGSSSDVADGPPSNDRVTKTFELVLHGRIPPTDSFRVSTTQGPGGIYQLCPSMDSPDTSCVPEQMYQNQTVALPGKPFDYVFERYNRQTNQTLARFGAGHDIDEHNSTIAGVYTYPGG